MQEERLRSPLCLARVAQRVDGEVGACPEGQRADLIVRCSAARGLRRRHASHRVRHARHVVEELRELRVDARRHRPVGGEHGLRGVEEEFRVGAHGLDEIVGRSLESHLFRDRADLPAQRLNLGESQFVNLLCRAAANDARADQELVVACTARKRGESRNVRRLRAVVGQDESLEAAQSRLIVVGDRAARIGSERRALRFGNAFGHARERRHQRALFDMLDEVGVDRPDDPVQHRAGAHPSTDHADPQPGDRVVGEPGCRADPFDVVAIVLDLAERCHLRGARQDVVQATERRQHQRVGIRKLLRLDREFHFVEQELVRNPVLAVQRVGIQRLQPRERRALTRVLAFERGERQVRQKMVVAWDPANGRLDRIAAERRVEVVVQQDFELCCRFGSGVFRLGVHAIDPEGDEKREEDNRAHAPQPQVVGGLGDSTLR